MAIIAVKHEVKLRFIEPVLGTVPMSPRLYKDYIESQKPVEQQEDEYKTVESKEGRGWTGFHRESDLYATTDALFTPLCDRLDERTTTDPEKAAKKDGKPIIARKGRLFTFDYTIRGFLKESANALRQIEAHDIRGVKSKIDQFVFVFPRRIYFERPSERWHKAGPVAMGGCGWVGWYDSNNGMCCHYVHEPDGCLERPLRAETAMGPRVALARSDYLDPGTLLRFDLKVLLPKVFTEEFLALCFERGLLLGWGQWRTGGYGRFEFQLTTDSGDNTINTITEAARAEVAKVKGERIGTRVGSRRSRKDLSEATGASQTVSEGS